MWGKGDTPRVSVCIPTYNGEEFVAEAVRSVLAQELQDFELLVVDDHSTDATLEVVRALLDPRIRVYPNNERLGIPGNWNRCLALARGEFFCLFHQDDVMLPENLIRKAHVLASDPTVGLVHSAAEIVVENSAPTSPADWIENSLEDFTVDGRSYFRKLLFHGNRICAPTVVARRQALLDLSGFDEDLGFTPDYEMWMKMCVKSRVAFLSQPLVRYRWHGTNASHAYRFERGVEEYLIAGRRALEYYLKWTKRQEEGEIFAEGLVALSSLRRWAVELERAKAWLEEQRLYWRAESERQVATIAELRGCIAELEKGMARPEV